MKLTFITGDEISREDIQLFWDQGVCMDDWDYIILAPKDQLLPDVGTNYKGDPEPCWSVDYTLDRLLTGCCYNAWYKAKYKGRWYAVGVAYHS